MVHTNCLSCEQVIGQFHEDLKFDLKLRGCVNFFSGETPTHCKANWGRVRGPVLYHAFLRYQGEGGRADPA